MCFIKVQVFSNVIINPLLDLILELVIFLIFAWIFGILYLAPRLAKTKHLQAFGPMLMIKITKNRKILDRIANRFPARGFGKVSVVIVIISTIMAFVMLIYGAYLSLSVPPSSAPALSLLLPIPGVNPVIPVVYGTIALAISMVIHEIFHGIVARSYGIKVSSVGVLFFIVPMGAFVEPDEEEVQKADPVHRRRLIAAGPGINIVIAIITLVVVAFLLVPAATPTHQGFYVQTVDKATPAGNFVSAGVEITSFGNYTGNQVTMLVFDSQLIPGQLYNLTAYNGKTETVHQLPAGITIDSVVKGTAAENASLKPGMVIVSADGNYVRNDTSFNNFLESKYPGSVITLELKQYNLSGGNLVSSTVYKNVTTTSKYDYYSQYYPSLNKEIYKNQSFLGVTVSYAGMLGSNLSYMQNVISGRGVFFSPVNGILQYIALPFAYLFPVPAALTSLFTVPFYGPLFWGIVDTFYFLFWLDLLLGITNALPFLVFDGGQFFRESLIILSKRRRFAFLKNERTVRTIMNVMSVIVIVLLFWQIIVPRLI